MSDTQRHSWGSELPPEAGSIQLTVTFDVFRDEEGGCAASFSFPEESRLIEKYGTSGRALAACREAIVSDLEALIELFMHEDEFMGQPTNGEAH